MFHSSNIFIIMPQTTSMILRKLVEVTERKIFRHSVLFKGKYFRIKRTLQKLNISGILAHAHTSLYAFQ